MRLHHSNLMSQVASIKVLGQDNAIVKRARIQAHCNDLKRSLAKDKTYIGRISHGFNFLGFHHHPSGVGVSQNTLSRMFQKLAWQYAHQANKSCLQAYLKRWQTWVNSQVGDIRFPIKFNSNPNPLKPIRISLSLTNQGYVLSL